MNRVIEKRFTDIKEEALAMLINAKLNDTAHKMMLKEAVNMCEHLRKSMATMGSTTSPFEFVFGEKYKIIGSFS